MDVTIIVPTAPADFDNDSACLIKSLELESFFPLYLPQIQFALFLTYFVMGIPLNCCIIYLVANLSRFHTEFAFSMQVVTVDILLALCLPFAMGNMLGGSYLLVPAQLCHVMGSIKLYLRFVRYMMICLISLDRFSLVFFPFSYPTYRRRTTIFLCVIAWMSSALFASLPLIADCYGYLPAFGFCMLMAYCSPTCRSLTIGIEGVMIALGGFVPGVLFSLVFCKAMRMERSTSSPTSQRQSEVRRWKVTYILALLYVIVSSAPLVVLVFWESLYYLRQEDYEYWIFLGLSMTTLEAVVVVTDPIVMARNGQLRPAINALTASAKIWMKKWCSK